MREKLRHDFTLFQKIFRNGEKRKEYTSRYIPISKNVSLEDRAYFVTYDQWSGVFTFRSHEEDLVYAIVKGDLGLNLEPLIEFEDLQMALDEGVIRGTLES